MFILKHVCYKWTVVTLFQRSLSRVLLQTQLSSPVRTFQHCCMWTSVDIGNLKNTDVLWSFLFQEKRSNRSEATAIERRREKITIKETQNPETQEQTQTQKKTQRQDSFPNIFVILKTTILILEIVQNEASVVFKTCLYTGVEITFQRMSVPN